MRLYIKFILITFTILFSQTQSQIKQAKDYISKSGMSNAEVRSAAKARGASDEIIDKVLNKENNKVTTSLEVENEIIKTNDIEEFGESISIDEKNEIEEEINIEKKNQFLNNQLRHFGYDIFTQDPEIFQSSAVGAVDPDYLIGPGDEIIVMLWGETQFRQVLLVDRAGFIFIPEVGQVFVNGLTLNLLESKLFKVLSKSYDSLNPSNRKADTFLDVSLGKLRPLRIQVIGEVAQPGAYTVNPSATIFSSLYYFNGPTKLGSLRDIRLIRGGKEIAKIDFYDYLLTGKKLKDEKLQLDDVIRITKRKRTVSISGEVYREGIYELKENETLKNLIDICGGLKVTAYLKRAQIDRVVPFDQREGLGMDRLLKDFDLSSILNLNQDEKLFDEDKVKIFSIFDSRENSVRITGSVARPGDYELGEGLYLSQLILKADSLLGDAFLDRVDIIRTTADSKQKLIELDLKEVMFGDRIADIALIGMDKVHVYSKNEITTKKYVRISGHVKKPGRYPLLENMKIYDLVFLAGGLIDEDHRKSTFLNRGDLIRYDKDYISKFIRSFDLGAIYEDQQHKSNVLLQSGDEIIIYPRSLFNLEKKVKIAGNVQNPGTYSFKKGMNLKALILEAGGLFSDMEKYKIEISRIDSLKNNKDLMAESYEVEMFNDYSLGYIEDLGNSSKANKQFFSLRPYDYVIVRPDPYFQMQKTVSVTGEVLYPGLYVKNFSNETVSDIIERAGGLRPNAFVEGAIFTRKGININFDLEVILKKPDSKYDIILQNNDIINIPPKPRIIQILGEVSAPGHYKYDSGEKLRHYINAAGGFNQDAQKDDIFIRYSNGKSVKPGIIFSNPVIKDGSTIMVGKKKEEEPFDSTEFAKEITAILANIAQTIAVIILAKN